MIKCPVCGKYEFEKLGDYSTCPVCWWENDRYQYKYPDESCGANGISLNQARKNYKITGKSYSQEMIDKINQFFANMK